MKRFLPLIIVTLTTLTAKSQQVVVWKFSTKKIAEQKYEVHLQASVQRDWHIYSQTTPADGPLATNIQFSTNPLIVLLGKPIEDGDMERNHDETFGVDVYSYADKVDFVQIIKLKAKAKTKINGKVEFMACRDGKCLSPQKIPFTLTLE